MELSGDPSSRLKSASYLSVIPKRVDLHLVLVLDTSMHLLLLLSLLLKFIQLADRLDGRQFVNREIFQFLDKWMLLLGGEKGHLPSGGHGDVTHGFAACFGIAFALKLLQYF